MFAKLYEEAWDYAKIASALAALVVAGFLALLLAPSFFEDFDDDHGKGE